MTEIATDIEPTIAPPEDPLPTGKQVPVRLLMLALPIIASMLSHTLMQFIDFAMVAQLGTDATAAVLPAGIVVFCFISFGAGMLSMVNTFVSQSLGRNQPRECGAYGWQGVYISFALGLIVLPVILVVPWFFNWVGHESAVREMEIIYARIMFIGVGPALAAGALSNFFNGVHKPAVGLVAAVIGNVTNIVANYALIFGNWGFPELGIAGAAWGTVIGGSTTVLVLLLWMAHPRFANDFATLQTWRPSIMRLWRIVRTGMPAGLQHTADILTWTIFSLLLIGRTVSEDGEVTFDPVQQAANNVAVRYLHLAFFPAIGLGVAASAAVGKAIGQGRKPLARTIVRWATLFAMVYMGAIGITYWLFGEPMSRLLTDDPEVIDWASRLLLLCAVFQIFDALSIVHSFALRGAGDNLVPALILVASSIVIVLFGGYYSLQWYPHWGCIGPWAAATVHIILLGIVMWLRWQFGPWERIELIKDAA